MNKKNNRPKNHKIKQRGGVMISGASAKDAFEHFIKNSDISILTIGGFGLTLIAKLRPGIQTNYRHITAYKYNQPVDIILFKICCVYDKSAGEIQEDIDITTNNQPLQLRSVDIEDFKKEINIQTDIFFKSITYLQPYGPGIIYADFYKDFILYI